MLDPFNQKKESILKEILETNEQNKDLSPKGTIDERCLPIISLINNHKDMVTLSSCSGRVSVFVEGIKEHDQIGAKGNEGKWVYVNHNPDIENWNTHFDYKQNFDSFPDSILTRFILYKFEPLILHVKCRNFEMATELYKTAMNCGFRESGINNNCVVAIRISIKLDIPIGYLDNEEIVLNVNDNYIRYITKLSIDRFNENFKKLEQLYQAIKKMELPIKEIKETKEERRVRKMQEGLARRENVRKQKEQMKLEKLQAESNTQQQS